MKHRAKRKKHKPKGHHRKSSGKHHRKPPFKILSELEKLFEKGVFCDCTLQKQGMPCVILSGRENSKTSFVYIVCEKCNGTTRIRAGSSGKCEYCGNAISSRNTG